MSPSIKISAFITKSEEYLAPVAGTLRELHSIGDLKGIPRMPSISSVLSNSSSSTMPADANIAIQITKTRTRDRSNTLLSCLCMEDTSAPFALTRARMEEEDECAFSVGEVAWARGPNGKWRRVIVLDAGRWELEEEDEKTAHKYYGATWTVERMTYRAHFAPTKGEMLHNSAEVRCWLSRECWGEVVEAEKGALYNHFPGRELGGASERAVFG